MSVSVAFYVNDVLMTQVISLSLVFIGLFVYIIKDMGDKGGYQYKPKRHERWFLTQLGHCLDYA